MEAALQFDLVCLGGARSIALSCCIIPNTVPLPDNKKTVGQRHGEEPMCILICTEHYRNWGRGGGKEDLMTVQTVKK